METPRGGKMAPQGAEKAGLLQLFVIFIDIAKKRSQNELKMSQIELKRTKIKLKIMKIKPHVNG